MKVVIITGGAGGIGGTTAKKLAARGDAVMIAGRDSANLHAMAEAIGRDGGQIACCPADVGKPEQADHLVTTALNWKGRIDAVINCAGAAPMIPTSETTDAQWREILDVNLSSVFYMTRAIWKIFQRQYYAMTDDQRSHSEAGVIVNISSEAARNPLAGLAAYGSAKAGVNLLTMATAREGRDMGVRVVAIAPAAVETPMFRALPIASKIPAREILASDFVADAIVAALDGGLRYASGETIYIHRRCF